MRSTSREPTQWIGPIIFMWAALIVATIAMFAGCSLVDDDDPDPVDGAIIMADTETFDRADWPSARIDVDSIRVDRNSLVLDVTFSGGCADHTFDLVAYRYWMESFPVQLHALIAHEDNDDACDALVSRQLVFDLTPAKVAYREAYGQRGPIRIRLIDGEQDYGSFLYEF